MINTVMCVSRFSIFLVIMSTEKKSTSWSAYFDVTSPEKYSFLGYYEYRLKHEDFISSFRKECHRLKTDLANLMKNSSGEMKKVASRLEKSRKVKVFYRCFFALLVGI